MIPRISAFMPCYNKPPGFAKSAIQSCLDQDYPDWELWVLENSTDLETKYGVHYAVTDFDDGRIRYEDVQLSDGERANYDVPVYLCNSFYPYANGDLILYMSDDDLWMPGIFKVIAEHMDANPHWLGMYFTSYLCAAYSPDQKNAGPWIRAGTPLGAGQLDSRIDGGQMCFRKHMLYHPSNPRFPDDRNPATMSHSDGIFMEKLAKAGVVFHPVDYPGVIHRRTPYSNYTRP